MAKKKAEHHGGAWKVAYADFVTAMMALFIVLWICAQNEQVREATTKYFEEEFKLTNSEKDMEAIGGGKNNQEDKTDKKKLEAIAKEMQKMLKSEDVAEDRLIDFEVTSDSLKITLFDTTKKPLFEKNKAAITKWGDLILGNMSWIIDKYKMKVYIDGHAAAGPAKTDSDDYGLWELSADRANSARRKMVKVAVNPEKVLRVTGYADTVPLAETAPDSERNQRITLSLSLN